MVRELVQIFIFDFSTCSEPSPASTGAINLQYARQIFFADRPIKSGERRFRATR